MARKQLTEQDLLKGLDTHTAHADELAEPLPQELTPLERLRGSVKRYDRPTDPVWDEFLGSSEGVSDDLIEDSDQVLGKALCNAAEALGLSKTKIAGIIGREHTGIVRDGIYPNSKTGELAMMFIRVYRGLYAAVVGDQENMRHWMDTENQDFGQPPRQMMATCQGLVRVLMYLDAVRGKV
jgi:hypothetical protein